MTPSAAGTEATGIHFYYKWERKVVQPFWKTIGQLLTVGTQQALTEGLAINPKDMKTYIHRKTFHGAKSVAQENSAHPACRRRPWVSCRARDLTK